MRDIFYDTRHLRVIDKLNLCKDALNICYEHKIDILDCKVSWARQSTDLTIPQILKKLDKSCHFTVIERNFYEPHLEIGFCTMSDPSYFLWIFIDLKKKHQLLIKYNLDKVL